GSGGVQVKEEALARLEEDTARRNNRYLWEGAFFLVVLIGGMSVLSRAILRDRELRRRQQNFLAAISHEFKSPLASMRLAAETLRRRGTGPGPQRLARRLPDDGNRPWRMLERLVVAARLEEDRRPLARRTVDLERAVAAAVGEIAERAAMSGIA